MERFKIQADPKANDKQVIYSGNARFTILFDGIIRCEYDEDRIFEDRASQHIWNRNFECEFTKTITDDILTIKTSCLELIYNIRSDDFTKGLIVKMNDTTRRYGDGDPGNLHGTYRTVDNCFGNYNMADAAEIELSPGLISKSGLSMINDSGTLVFNDDGFLIQRNGNKRIDVYFTGYGKDYKRTLRDYYKITGNVPLIPYWALGIWWSRWEKYSQQDILQNAAEFKEYDIPLSACVIDMDWHIVDNPYTDGWTGYTWNRELFPAPTDMFDRLHSEGIHCCMNLHPAGGVHPHEEKYPEMAAAMGIDSSTGEPVEFDISNPVFIDNYFKVLHHPLECDGVDFWWIDWQQGTKSKMSGLDPLWYLNHLHAVDLKRDGKKRPFTFSRWAGSGAHRYPIGFSGDSYARWDTLAYLPYFTANAANVGYGWWSHDVGGFARGYHHDDELFTRWIQFAVFSPIFRLHCCGDPTLDYKPWTKPEPYKTAAIKSMKLRRALMPYLYTAAYKNSLGEPPLVRGMYFDYPESPEAYACSQQYMFGDEIIAAPFTSPVDDETGMAKQIVWLPPEGEWYGLFDGKRYQGGRFMPVYGQIDDCPVFVKSGACIPLMLKENLITCIVFPGSGSSVVYYDNGKDMGYTENDYTLYEIVNNDNVIKVNLLSGEGRTVDFEFIAAGDKNYNIFNIIENPENVNSISLDNGTALITRDPQGDTDVLESFTNMIKSFYITAHAGRPILKDAEQIIGNPSLIKKYKLELTEKQLKCLLELITDSGTECLKQGNGSYVLYYWNSEGRNNVSVYTSKRFNHWYETSELSGPGSGCEVLKPENTWNIWEAYAVYSDLLYYKYEPEKSRFDGRR